MDTVVQAEQVFVDASGRRARRVTRCGYLLGLGCLGYIGMVAMGLSGTRVAVLPGVPTSAENEIIAGLSGESGAIGLHLTPVPVLTRPATARSTEAHAAAVRSAAAHSAALAARATAARSRPSSTSPATLSQHPGQQVGTERVRGEQVRGQSRVLAQGGSPSDQVEPADASAPTDSKELKAQEKADAKAEQKADAKHAKHGSDDDKSY